MPADPQSIDERRILVTGFAPYHEPDNASGRLIESLQRELPAELIPLSGHLIFEVIDCDTTSRETEHASLQAGLIDLLERHRPAICIFTGQSPACNRITIERIGTNSFYGELIEPDWPVAYWSNLPDSEELKAILEDSGIPCGYSFDAGQHLCNHILFSSRHLAESPISSEEGKEQFSHRSGFVHIPLLPEQVASEQRSSASMSLQITRKALSLIIRHVHSQM